MARHSGVSKSTVQRWFDLFGLQPRRQRHFMISKDPFFAEKVRNIVGLYLYSPDHTVLLAVDEKALQRTQPVLPMGLGYLEGVTRCHPRHRHQEFLAFLRQTDRNVPHCLDIHLIVDNYATHKHPKVHAGLARRPGYHLHFTPT